MKKKVIITLLAIFAISPLSLAGDDCFDSSLLDDTNKVETPVAQDTATSDDQSVRN